MSDNFSANGKTFVTSRGIAVRFQGIAMMLDKLRASFQFPKPPTYEVKVAATGVTEIHEHDEKTIETDEEKALWAQYIKNSEDAQTRYNLALTRTVLLRGLQVEMPSDESWIKQQELIGLDVPKEETAKRLHWLETEVIGGVQDMEAIMLGVMKASGVPEELLASIADSFRGQVGKSNGTEVARPDDSVHGEGLELQQTLRGSDDRIRNEDTTISI